MTYVGKSLRYSSNTIGDHGRDERGDGERTARMEAIQCRHQRVRVLGERWPMEESKWSTPD